MRFVGRRALVLTLALATLPTTSAAQEPTYFAGLIAWSSQLSGDPTTIVTGGGFVTSDYKPATGPAVNVFAGVHLREHLTLQANYTWNRNGVTLFAAEGTPTESRFYEQPHAATQHTLIGDVLVYFRERASRIRPYLFGVRAVRPVDRCLVEMLGQMARMADVARILPLDRVRKRRDGDRRLEHAERSPRRTGVRQAEETARRRLLGQKPRVDPRLETRARPFLIGRRPRLVRQHGEKAV